ncbi:MAG TPA: hypothetical protein VL754_18775 [Verrucomicrobiae bacterium]|jgi:hypothetical protein|nr:hypothetical protein [Verrucomicrobiae bacterium]
MSKPRVLFAIGDVDWKYSRGKLRHMVKRVADQGSCEVAVASHDAELCREFEGEIASFHMPGAFPGVLPQHALAMSDLMIRYTSDVLFPDSRFPFWKTMATDDFVGCFTPSTHPSLPFRPDIVVYPLMGIDNSTIGANHFYTEVVRHAHSMNVPILGIEISPLGDRQCLGASLADYYAMKTEFSRSFIVRQELAPEERVFVMPPLESYLLTCRNDSLLEDFFPVETGARKSLGVPPGYVTVFVPHNVAFVYETRRILAALSALNHPAAVLLGVNPDVARHSRKEREIAEIVYRDEIAKLPCVLICEERGWRELLLMSDVVVGPNFSIHTELASHYDKLAIVCQAMSERVWIAESFYVEPESDRIAGLIDGWIDHCWTRRKSLAEIIASILGGKSERKREVKVESKRQEGILLHRP